MARTTGKKRFGLAALAAAGAVLLSSCGFQAAESGEIGVIQNGDFLPGADKELIGCLAPETTENRIFDSIYWYPARQISWDATGGEGAERAPYTVVSNAEAAAELDVPVVVTMDITQDCEELQQFHRSMGTKYSAWMVEEDGTRVTSPGWVSLLNYAVGQPTEVTLVRLAQKYPWQEIWNDDAIRVEFEQALARELPERIKQRAGGEFFTNIQVTVGKPDPVNDELKTAIAKEQQVLTEANAKREAAIADVEVAKEETKVAQERARQREAEIAGYPSVEDYLKAQMIEKGLNPYQPQLVPLPSSGS